VLDPTGISFNNPAGVHSQSTQNIIIIFCKYLFDIWELGLATSFLGIHKSKICCIVSLYASTPYTVAGSSSLYNDDISVYFPSHIFPRNNFALLTVLGAWNPTPFKWFATIFSNQAECIKRIIFSAKIVPQFGDILTLQLTGNFSNLRNLGRFLWLGPLVRAYMLRTPWNQRKSIKTSDKSSLYTA